MIKRIRLYDLIVNLAIIITLSMHDQKVLVIGIQFLLIGCFILKFCRNGKILIIGSAKPFLIRYGMFILLCMVSYIWSINKAGWLKNNISIMQCVCVGVCIIYYADSSRRKNNILHAAVAGALILAARMILFVPISAWGMERVGDYVGYGNVGVTYVMAPASIISFYLAYKEKNKMLYAATAVLFVLSALSGSKKGPVVFAVGLAIILIKASKDIRKLLINLLFAGALLGIIYLMIMKIPVLYNALGIRIVQAFGQLNGTVLDKSTRDRMILLQDGIKAFLQNPILGVGIDGFKNAQINRIHYYAHNNYVELLADCGILGCVIYYLPLYKHFFQKAFGKINLFTDDILAIALMGALMIGDITSVSYFQESLQIFYAISFMLICYDKREKKRNLYKEGM